MHDYKIVIQEIYQYEVDVEKVTDGLQAIEIGKSVYEKNKQEGIFVADEQSHLKTDYNIIRK